LADVLLQLFRKIWIAVVSPPLIKQGNSVKGQYAIKYVIEQLKVNPHLIQPKQ
jgi:glutaminase